MKKIKDFLPDFYHPILPDFFEKEIPEEIFASCDDCQMTCNSREEINNNKNTKPFSPDTKCCTYYPYLSNFLVGAVLSDTDPSLDEAKKRLRQKIIDKNGVFPNGIFPPAKYRYLYQKWSKNFFGRSLEFKCPYYVDGKYNCLLWKYRDSVCLTWFCVTTASSIGNKFWELIMNYLSSFQELLYYHVLMKENLSVSFPYNQGQELSYEDIEGIVNQKEYELKWGKWCGKEEEFYINAYNIIKNLSKKQVEEIAGDYSKRKLYELNACYQEIMQIPDFLKLNPILKLNEVIEGTYRITTYSYKFHSISIPCNLDLPKIVIDLFDGKRKTSEIIDLLEKSHDITLEKDILVYLYKYGILIQT